jgi:transporter family protein
MKVLLLAMLTALLWGFAPVFDKLGLGKASPMAALSIRTLVVAVGMAVFLTASGGWREISSLDRRTVTYIVLGAIAAGLLGQLTYYCALKSGQATTVVPVAAIYPLVAAALAILFLREPITPGKVLGSVLIALGILAIRMDSMLWPR